MKQYFRHKIENLLNVSKIITIHYFEFDKDFKSAGESHDFWEIVFAQKNNLIISADGEDILLREGEIYFHKPNQYHKHSSDGNLPPNVFIASFESKSQSMHFFENKKFKLNDELISYIQQILNEARRTFNIPYSDPDTKKMDLHRTPTLGGSQLIKNILEILLINIMRSRTETTSGNNTFLPEKQLDNRLVNDIISILNERVFDRLTIKDITGSTYYGRAYIFKEFKRVTGKSIMAYYDTLKIEKAKHLLKNPNYSIKEISEILSFDTPNYFSKFFKKHTNLTPTEYKKGL